MTLIQNVLTGTLNPSVGSLVALSFLSLNSNQFYGNIYIHLDWFSHIETRICGIGSIPTAIGQLINLSGMLLGGNKFNGSNLIVFMLILYFVIFLCL